MKLEIAGFLVSVLALGSFPLSGADLRSELRDRSAAQGLALAAASAGSVEVIPFDGPVNYFETEHRFPLSVFGKGGRMVLWWWPNGFFDLHGSYVINLMVGEEVARGRSSPSGFSPVGLSEEGKRLAFWGKTPYGKTQGLYWASFDFTSYGFVATGTPNPDWSPDGRQLVFEQEGRVTIHSLINGSARVLTAGYKPTWDPDGKHIAFIAPNGQASLVSLDGSKEAWLLSNYRPLTAMRWSPDGRYISFSEARPPIYALVDQLSQLVVIRVSDGKSIGVRNFGSLSVNNGAFTWILNYRSFCRVGYTVAKDRYFPIVQ